MKFFSVLVLFLSSTFSIGASESITSPQEDEIWEATFRYMLNEASQSQQYSAFYLEIFKDNEKFSPDAAFLKRFADHKPPVKKISECTWDADDIRDETTHQKGLLLSLGFPRWTSDTEVQMDGSYTDGFLNASGWTFYLIKENGRWKVHKSRSRWIS